MDAQGSTTSRVLRALELVRVRPGVTAGELAERLGVSERAVRRYVALLRDAGVDVRSSRGPHGGYRLRQAARLPVELTQPEALGLVMAVIDARPPGEDRHVDAALGKVLGTLPQRVAPQVATLLEHARAAPDPIRAAPAAEVTGALIDAVATHHTVRLTYRPAAGGQWRAHVDPWAVVVRHGRWYLLCHAHHVQATRAYRIDRVIDARATASTFDPPDGLEPVSALETHLGTGWRYSVRVVFDAPAVDVQPWIRGPMGTLEPLDDGCVLVGSTSNPHSYAAEWLARIPFGFRVAGGPELSAAVNEIAKRLTAACDPSRPDRRANHRPVETTRG